MRAYALTHGNQIVKIVCIVEFLFIYSWLAFYYGSKIYNGRSQPTNIAIFNVTLTLLTPSIHFFFECGCLLFVCLFVHLKVVNQVIIVQTRNLYSNLFVFSKTFGSPENLHQQTSQPTSHSFIYHKHR